MGVGRGARGRGVEVGGWVGEEPPQTVRVMASATTLSSGERTKCNMRTLHTQVARNPERPERRSQRRTHQVRAAKMILNVGVAVNETPRAGVFASSDQDDFGMERYAVQCH